MTTFRAALSHAAYARGATDRLVVKIDVAAPSGNAGASSLRPPVDVVLVIDRSGSMAQERKFEFALRGAGVVVENLSERDEFALVAFADDAIVLSPTGRVVNKQFLTHRLTEVDPEGWTNLSAGLLAAFAQYDRDSGAAQTEPRAQHVVLLTDGKANRGVTDPLKLRAMVEAARKRGISVSTMGVGTDFDGKLLADLAEAGGGRYTYAKAAEDIPSAMAAEVGGLLDVVAQGAELRVRATGGAEITRVFGSTQDQAAPEQVFKLGDLRRGERGVFVLELRPTSFADGGSAGVQAELSYDDPAKAMRVKESADAAAVYVADRSEAEKTKDAAVALYAEVLVALEDAEEAAAGLDKERAAAATRRFDALYARAREAALAAHDQELLNQAFMLKHFAQEIKAAERSGLLHGHEDAKAQLKKEAEYRRYLLGHHRERP